MQNCAILHFRNFAYKLEKSNDANMRKWPENPKKRAKLSPSCPNLASKNMPNKRREQSKKLSKQFV